MPARNPFACDAATHLTPQKINDIYISDFNYSRFLNSKKNVFLVGDRGTGKTMSLLYNSLQVQTIKGINLSDLDIINIYVPCNTPLMHGREYEILETQEASSISEHFFVLAIIYSLSETLSKVNLSLTNKENKETIKDINHVVMLNISETDPVFKGLQLELQRLLNKTKSDLIKSISLNVKPKIFGELLTFSGHAISIMKILLSLKGLHEKHFSLMIDDAQYLDKYQVKKLNSWIAFRDHSTFSFKISTTKVDRPTYETDSGDCLVENHDFIVVDMEDAYQNKMSNFSKLAHRIIEKRLKDAGINISADSFFPMNSDMKKDLAQSEIEVKEKAIADNPDINTKQLRDHIYKYSRAKYFRSRPKKANLPPYSGFNTLVHLSTGVVRELLEPCFWMYEAATSELSRSKDAREEITTIKPSIQTKIIVEQSRKKWEWVNYGLDKVDCLCSPARAKHVYQLLDNLCELFRKRLLDDISEPRAVMFSISEKHNPHYEDLLDIIHIARRSQCIFERLGTSKDDGKHEMYYVLNKILLPYRGLDPVGQHARVSLTTSALYAAAVHGEKIPYKLHNNQSLPLLDV